ncbi:MAG: metal-sulfur cluster assembly factor [Gemmatimonadota bacterium]
MERLVQLKRRPEADAGYESDLERGMDFSAVFAETIGRNPDFALEVPEWGSPPADLVEAAWRALHEVPDPEFPISLPDLGLVYDIEAAGSTVRVTVTFTASACPCVEFIKWDIRERLLEEPGIEDVVIEITWDPPWTTDRITERGRRALKRAGVSI